MNIIFRRSAPTALIIIVVLVVVFGLNYLVLGAALTIIITLFRFNLVQRACGKYVQEQLYLSIVWAGPLLVLATAIALLLVAMA